MSNQSQKLTDIYLILGEIERSMNKTALISENILSEGFLLWMKFNDKFMKINHIVNRNWTEQIINANHIEHD